VAVLLVDRSSGALTRRDGGESDVRRAAGEASPLAQAAARTGEVQVAGVPGRGGPAGSEGPELARAGLRRSLAELAVPIKVQERVVGVLDIRAESGQSFDELDVFTTATLADQLAIAIQNSELYEQAQELATVQERQRLARDLHDAVSQTLFSSCLIAEVLPRLWEKDPQEGRRRMQELQRQTKGALAEMRMLLLELRPATLLEAPLGELLHHLTDAFISRAGIPASLAIEGDEHLPGEVQVALYRIAQETLNNAVKHSQASEVRLRCRLAQGEAEIEIQDDGVGFEPAEVGGDHLGLDIMTERAVAVGAELDVRSRPGGGTSVRVRWTEPRFVDSAPLVGPK
jgi:signal transduction histidine kinase